MVFFFSSEVDEQTLTDRLGRPQYSYWFLRQLFRAGFERLGAVVGIERPDEVRPDLVEAFRRVGEDCLLVSFSPPNLAPVTAACPVLTVFAWEFDRIPDEAFDGDPRQDWRTVLRSQGRTITLSTGSARAVEAAMGPGFPVAVIPAPVFDRMEAARRGIGTSAAPRTFRFPQGQDLTDSRTLVLDPDSRGLPPPPPPAPPPAPVPAPKAPEAPLALLPVPPPRKTLRHRLGLSHRLFREWYRLVVRDLLPTGLRTVLAAVANGAATLARTLFGSDPHGAPPAPPRQLPDVPPPPAELPPPEPSGCPVAEAAPAGPAELPPPPPPGPLEGIVYTSVFNPYDGRKNWHEIVSAFCWTFRREPRATLFLKMVQPEGAGFDAQLRDLLGRHAPFECRVIAAYGLWDEDLYRDLVAASSFYVNASHCEGLCIPLLEFLSCGKPAIAPFHTAMADYLDEAFAFPVRSAPEPAIWPHDTRTRYVTNRHRTEWKSLADAFRKSFDLAVGEPAHYAAMASRAIDAMRGYCSDAVVVQRLSGFLGRTAGVRAVEAS